MNMHVNFLKEAGALPVALALTEAEVLAMTVEDFTKWQGDAVEAWAEVFKQTPTLDLQMNLVVEEAHELGDAGIALDSKFPTVEQVANLLKEASDLQFVVGGASIITRRLKDDNPLVALAVMLKIDEFTTIASEALVSSIQEFQWNQDVFLEAARVAYFRVVQSNLTKLDDNGEPIFNEDGKIQKGPNYQAPNLDDLAEKVLASVKTGNVIH